MKRLIICFLTLMFTMSSNAEETNQDPIIEFATIYFAAITEGDTETVDRLASIPFSYMKPDRILTNYDQLKERHKRMLKSFGKRAVPKNEVSKLTEYPELDPIIFRNDYEVIRITILEGEFTGDAVDLYIQKLGDEYSVIGIAN